MVDKNTTTWAPESWNDWQLHNMFLQQEYVACHVYYVVLAILMRVCHPSPTIYGRDLNVWIVENYYNCNASHLLTQLIYKGL